MRVRQDIEKRMENLGRAIRVLPPGQPKADVEHYFAELRTGVQRLFETRDQR